jgi:hypothetical protein
LAAQRLAARRGCASTGALVKAMWLPERASMLPAKMMARVFIV